MQRTIGLLDTTVGKKALVAVSGVILFGFLVGHLLGNLQVFLGRDVFNHYAATLASMPALVWGTRIVLSISVVTHIAMSMQLAARSRGARPQRYHMKRDSVTNYAAKTMFLSGPIIAFYILFHLAHFTLGVNLTPGHPFLAHDAYANLVYGFRNVPIAALYIIANALVAMHLYHGSTSFLQSLGLEHPRYDRLVRGAALALALFVGIGNVMLPLAVQLGLAGGDLPSL